MHKTSGLELQERVTGQLLRQTTGRFATGVTVITAPNADGPYHGMTANGFTSVSLEPPLVLVSLGNQTKTNQLLGHETRFGISILARNQAHVAHHFAGKPGAQVPELVDTDGVAHVEGALGFLSCTVVDQHPAGDHTLVVARVDNASHTEGQPLVFNQGRMVGIEEEVAA